jgi:hypothetical protein
LGLGRWFSGRRAPAKAPGPPLEAGSSCGDGDPVGSGCCGRARAR